MRTITAAVALAVVTACGGASLKEAGEECVASSECAAGLVCDLGQNPAVCAGNTTADAVVIDAAPGDDAPEVIVDGAPIDGEVIVDGAVIDGPPPADAAVIDAPPAIDAAAAVDASPDA